MQQVKCPNCGSTFAAGAVSQHAERRVTETRDAGVLNKSTKERRSVAVTGVRVERDAAGKPTKIVGHAAVFGELSKPLTLRNGTKFREKIQPGAFTRSIQAMNGGDCDIRALVGHDPDKLLARSSAGKLTLTEDDKGLAFEITPPDTTLGNDAIADIEHGNIRGMSFGFDDPEDSWEKSPAGENIRTLKDIPLGEISLTPYPAYEGTDVDVRSIQQKIATLENRATVTYEDCSLQYAADYVRSAAAYAFDAIRGLLRTLDGMGDTELSPADQSALADAMDEVLDLDAKIDQVSKATDGKYTPLNDDGNEDDRDDPASSETVVGDMSSTDDLDGEIRKLQTMVTRQAESGQSTAELREQIGILKAKRTAIEARGGHMTHSNTPSLNSAAELHAMELIKAGKVDDGEWSFSSEDADALLGKDPNYAEYAKWFLAIDKNADEKTRDAYKYPVGKDGKVYTRALNAIRKRANEQGATAIYDAAGKLIDATTAAK